MSLLGIDVGTSGCKSVAFDLTGRVIASCYQEYDTQRDATGRSELDAAEVWSKIAAAIRACTAATAGDPVTALSVTSMGEAMVPVDAAGNITGPSILGSDTRGAAETAALLESRFGRDALYRTTAVPFGAGYSFTTLKWIRDHEEERWRKTAYFLPWADFVVCQLTGKMLADYSLAERTCLFDFGTKTWSLPLLAALDLDPAKFPEPRPAGSVAGPVTAAAARELGLPAGSVVVLGTHDQCAGIIGSGATQPGGAMLGLGTFACLAFSHDKDYQTSNFSELGLNVEDHAAPGQQVSFIYHGSGGALVKWLRKEFFRDYAGPEAYRKMDAELAGVSFGNALPVVLPYFAETGPFEHRGAGAGSVSRLSLASTRSEIFWAAMAGVICYFRDALTTLQLNDANGTDLRITGGGANSAVWCQIAADVLQREVVKTSCGECGALGCAMTAAAATGIFRDLAEAAAAMVHPETRYEPGDTAAADRFFAAYCEEKRRLFR